MTARGIGVLVGIAALAACLVLWEGAPAAAPGKAAPAAPADTMVSVGTHRLHVMTTGEGRPPVVIDVGFGDSPSNWTPVVERVAKQTQVVTYERAGYGRSEPGPLPRTSDRAVDELAAALRGAGIEPPYVFVGHSLGALNMLLMGARHPELAAGLVLVNPPPIGFLAGGGFPELRADAESTNVRLARDAEAAAASPDSSTASQVPRLRTLASEYAMMFSTDAQQAAEIDSLGELRLTVIAAGNANPEFGQIAFKFQEYWIGESSRIAERSSRPRLRIARSGSAVHREAPDVVVEEITAMVDSVRADTKSGK